MKRDIEFIKKTSEINVAVPIYFYVENGEKFFNAHSIAIAFSRFSLYDAYHALQTTWEYIHQRGKSIGLTVAKSSFLSELDTYRVFLALSGSSLVKSNPLRNFVYFSADSGISIDCLENEIAKIEQRAVRDRTPIESTILESKDFIIELNEMFRSAFSTLTTLTDKNILIGFSYQRANDICM